MVSPEEKDNSLWINQNARFALTNLDAEKEISYSVHFKGNGVYIFVIEGSIRIGGQTFGKRDAIGIYDSDTITIESIEKTELLAIEVPMMND